MLQANMSNERHGIPVELVDVMSPVHHIKLFWAHFSGILQIAWLLSQVSMGNSTTEQNSEALFATDKYHSFQNHYIL